MVSIFITGSAKHKHVDNCYHSFMCNLCCVYKQSPAPRSNWPAEVLEVDMPTHAIGASDFFLLRNSLSNVGCSKCHIVFFLSWTPMQVPLSFFTLRKYRNTK